MGSGNSPPLPAGKQAGAKMRQTPSSAAAGKGLATRKFKGSANRHLIHSFVGAVADRRISHKELTA
jgi:hypothetical protein